MTEAAPEAVRYAITPAEPGAHLYRVTVTVADPDPTGQVFSLPAWIPGSYMIRDYARHIVAIEAQADDRPVALEKVDKTTWRAEPCHGPLTVTTPSMPISTAPACSWPPRAGRTGRCASRCGRRRTASVPTGGSPRPCAG